jgi:uncharacterized protein YbjT (DUF2867 family)
VTDPRRPDERVLVIGATRGTGIEIVARLLRDGFPVRVLARDDRKARALFGASVEIVQGDLTQRASLVPAVCAVRHVISTAGVTKRPASERSIIAVEYDGVVNAIAAAHEAGLTGRFLYMTAIGVMRHSLAAIALNLIKGRTLVWRQRAEEEIRRSGLDYTVIRCGVLRNAPAARHAIEISQRNHPMALWRRIGRADAAEVFVQALQHSATSRTTFDALWSHGPGPRHWDALFADLRRDDGRPTLTMPTTQGRA